VRCRERFDNSPQEALTRPWPEGCTALVATTSGTPAMFAAQEFQKVYVGSLVNFSALVAHLSRIDTPVTLIPAARPGVDHVEDEITAQAMATALGGFANLPDFVRQCAEQAKERVIASGRPDHLARKLATGAPDVKIAMEIDRYADVVALNFHSPLFALARFEEK
jgi:phosphosulfolactate phosphohydrolase-like enzyme